MGADLLGAGGMMNFDMMSMGMDFMNAGMGIADQMK
jgi:hypothetical protein